MTLLSDEAFMHKVACALVDVYEDDDICIADRCAMPDDEDFGPGNPYAGRYYSFFDSMQEQAKALGVDIIDKKEEEVEAQQEDGVDVDVEFDVRPLKFPIEFTCLATGGSNEL